MKLRGLKSALHLLLSTAVAVTSLSLTPMVAQADTATNIAPNPEMVCDTTTCTMTFPYVAGKYYVYTPPQGAEVTIRVTGGAGGTGGGDAWNGGGAGATGSRVSTTLVTSLSGTVLKIYPGSAGGAGWSGAATGGGAGGLSTFGNYNGGRGGNACNEGGSGGGGGGGAASLVQIDESTDRIIAAGGGGGAGASQYRWGAAGNGVSGVAGTTAGGAGGSMSGCDGAGAGAGGGGLLGGTGGWMAGYDWPQGQKAEWYGTGGYTGTSGGPTGSTVTNNVAGATGHGSVVVSFLNLFANISSASNFEKAADVTFNVTFPREVTGLTIEDFELDTARTTATGCTAPSALVGTGTTYSVKVTGCSEGALAIKLRDKAAIDTQGLESWLSFSNLVTIDRTAASLSITSPATPSNATTLNYSVVTNEALTSETLTTSDFTVTGAGCAVSAVTSPTSPAISPYTVAVTGCATGQSAAVTLKSGSATDLAGNASPTANVTSTAVTTDYNAPGGSFVVPSYTSTTLATNYFTFLTNENIAPASLAAADFENAGTATGCVFTPTLDSRTITLAVSSCSTGTLIPRLKQNSLTDLSGNNGPAAAITGPTLTIDRSVATATITAAVATTPTNAKTPLAYTVAFNEPISELTVADFSNTGTATGCVFTSTLSADRRSAAITASFCSDGTVIPTLAARSVTDAAGNLAPAAVVSATAITLDRTPVSVVSSTTAVTSPTKNSTIVYNMTMSELWTNSLTAADFTNVGTATGCSIAIAWVSGTTISVTVTNCSTSGTLKPVLAAKSFTDAVGNLSPEAAYTLPELVIDRVAPTVTAGTAPGATVETLGALTWNYSFSEPMLASSITAADFSNVAASPAATGCVFTPTLAGNGLSLSVTATNCSEGNVKLRLASGSVSDPAGNTAPAAALDSADTSLINTTPRVSFTAVPAANTNATSLSYTATFSESVKGAIASAFEVTGTATGCQLASSVASAETAVTSATLTVTGCSEGTVIVAAKARTLTDVSTALRVGPDAKTSASAVAIDRTAPAATFSPTTPINGAVGAVPLSFTVKFSEPIAPASLVAADFANGASAPVASSCVFAPVVSADGRSAVVTVTGCGTGNLLPQLSDSSGKTFSDLAGNVSATTAIKLTATASATTPLTIVVDRSPATATLVASPNTSPTAAADLTYNLTFNEAVTGLTASDFTNAGTATGCVFAPATANPAAGAAVVVTVSGCSSGTVVLTLASGSVNDLVGTASPAANLVAAGLTVDKTGPTVTLTSATTASTNASAITLVATFNEPTSNIVAADFENAGTATGCVFAPAAATASNAVNLLVTGCSEGTLQPRLKAASVTDALGNTGPAVASALASPITIDKSAPAATIVPVTVSPTNATTLSYTVNFTDAVSGIAAADFSNAATTGAATGCVFTPSAASGTSVTVNVTNCSAGSVTLKLAADGVTNLVSQTGPTVAVEATPISIDRTVPTAMVIAPITPNNSVNQEFRLTFGEAITGLTLSDLSITGASGCAPALTNVTATGATLTLSNCAPGLLRVALAKDSISDLHGNLGPSSEVVTEVGIDRLPPVFTINAPSSPNSGTTLTYSVAVNETLSPGSLTVSDFVVTGEGCRIGTLSNPVNGISPFTVTVTGCVDGATSVVSIPARSSSDLALNLGPATTASSSPVISDRTKPNSSISTSFPSTTNASIISYTIVTDEELNPASVTAADFANAATAPAATGCVFSPYVVGKTITVTITGCSAGKVVLRQSADSMADVAGNTGPATLKTGPEILIDRTAPTASLAAAVTTSPSPATSFIYNATFNEAVSGLTSSDFTNAGTATGCVFTPTMAVNNLSATVAITGCSAGTLIPTQAAASVADLAGNTAPANAITMPTITIDRTAATATLTTAVTSPVNSTSIVYTATFSEAVTGLASADFTNGGTATGCAFAVAGSGTTYTVTVTSCSTAGTLRPTLAQNGVTDGANTAPAVAVSGSELLLDRVAPAAPTVALTTVVAGTVITVTPLVYTFTFTEPLSEGSLAATDFKNAASSPTAGGCVFAPVLSANKLVVTVTVTGCFDGNVKPAILANAVTDVAGNAGPATETAIASQLVIDTAPRALFTTAPPAQTKDASLSYTVTFSESVTGVTLSDFAITGTANGCVPTLSAPANGTTATSTATLSLASCSEGTVIVTLAQNAIAANTGGASGPAANVLSTVTVDRSPATATIAAVGTITNPTGAAPMTFKVTFNEPVNPSTLVASDFSNTAGAPVASGCVFGAPVVAADGRSAEVTVSNCGSGGVNPTLAMSSVTDLAGNVSPAAAVKLATQIVVDRVPPTATITTAVTTPTSNASIPYTLTFTEAVTGITGADFTNTGTATGCVFAVAGSGTTYTVTATGCSTSGTLIVNAVAGAGADSLGIAAPASAVVASTITLDRVAPTATMTTASGLGVTAGTAITYTVTFNEAIDGTTLTASDFENIGTASGCTFANPVVAANRLSATVLVSSCARPLGETAGVTIEPSLKVNSVTDAFGNAGPAIAATNAAPVWIAGTANPTGTISAPSSPTNSNTQVFTVTMTDYVYTVNTLRYSNALAGQPGAATGCTFTASASAAATYTVTASNCSSGNLALKFGPHVPNDHASAVFNAANVWTLPGSQFVSPTVVIDRAPATVTITSVYGDEASVPKFMLDYSEAVSGLTLDDLRVVGDPRCQIAITSNSELSAEVTLTNCTPGNVARLTLAAGALADQTGNASPVTVVSSEPVTILLAEQAPLNLTSNFATQVLGVAGQLKVSVPTTGVGSGSGTGAVTYSTSTEDVCSINATTGVITPLTLGDCVVEATKAGDSNFSSATSNELTIPLTKTLQARLNATALPQSLVYSPTATSLRSTITIAGGSGAGPLSTEVSEASQDICSIEGLVVTMYLPGDCEILVTKDGGELLEAATALVTVKMTAAAQAGFVAEPSVTSVPWNTDEVIEVVAPEFGVGSGSGSGAISYASTTSDVCDVNPTTGVVIIPEPAIIGTCRVVASKAADEFFAGAVAPAVAIQITKAPQDELVLVAEDDESAVADAITISVSDTEGESGSGTGRVTFSVLPESVAVCSINPATGVILGKKPGECLVKATKAEDTLYSAVTSETLAVEIVKAAQEILFVPIAQLYNGGKPFVAGKTGAVFSLLATTNAPGVKPTFVSTTPTICTVVGDKVTPRGIGTCTITASAGENANYFAAPNVTKSFPIVVSPIPQTLEHTAPARIALNAPSTALVATLKSVLPNTGATPVVNGVTPLLTVDKASAKICKVESGKLVGLTEGTCNYSLSGPKIGAFTAVAPVKYSTVFYAGENVTTQNFPVAVSVGNPRTIVMTTDLLPLRGVSSAGLPVTYNTSNAAVCWADASGMLHLASAGTCSVTASSGGPGFKTSSSSPVIFEVTKANQTLTFTAPGEVIPGSSPERRAQAATDSDTGFLLSATLSSGLTPTFVSLDPSICSVEEDGSVTWENEIPAAPATRDCRVSISAPGDAAYNALPERVVTITARHSNVVWDPKSGPVPEKPVFMSVPRTGGKVQSGANGFTVTTKNNTVEVKPFSTGLYIGKITSVIRIPYQVTVNGVVQDKVQTCTTNFGILKKIPANKKPLAKKLFTNSITCKLNKDAFAYFKTGVPMNITATVTRFRLWPTTMQAKTPSGKVITPRVVVWNLTVG